MNGMRKPYKTKEQKDLEEYLENEKKIAKAEEFQLRWFNSHNDV